MTVHSIAHAHQQARADLDATGRPWKMSGVRMAYRASMLLADGRIAEGLGKSQLAAMRDLYRRYLASSDTSAA